MWLADLVGEVTAMSLRITTEDLRAIAGDVALSAAEVDAIARLAYLAAEIDFDEDPAEGRTLDGLYGVLGGLARGHARTSGAISPLPIDDEERLVWIGELAGELQSAAAAEIAFAVAYALVVTDLELAPIEGRLLDDVQQVLGISDERAAEIAALTAARGTPGVEVPASETRPWRA